ncbi:MAG: hypothetical protein HFJ86_09815 [Oscillospiraceae bacterium]|nr:hypothetical protein [Oscillospiraceae bacterium]
MKKIIFNINKIEIENVLYLMDIYLSEWEHRDELLWKQVFKYFYATLIVLFLPNLASFLNVDLPAFPQILFPIVALILSLVFLYVSIGYSKRLEASGNTYQKLINLLPEELQRVSVSSSSIKFGKFFSKRMSIVICILMFLGLFCLSIIMIIYYFSTFTN